MRCVSLCVRGEWFRVPCGSPSGSVQLLGSEALRRYHQAKKLEDAEGKLEFSMMRCRGGELLHPEDRTEDVLEDNDFVQLGKGLQHILPACPDTFSSTSEIDKTFFFCFLESLQRRMTNMTVLHWPQQCILPLTFTNI